MRLFDIYTWFAGSKASFANQFSNNEVLYNQACSFWSKLESLSVLYVVVLFIISIGFAVSYYTWWNKKPGRRYHPKYWAICGLFTLLFTLLSTWGLEYFSVPPKLNGSGWLEFKVALCNTIYSGVLYFLVSFVWCNTALPTNAYKWLKIKKS